MLPLFQFAVFIFLRDCMFEIAVQSRGGACAFCALGRDLDCVEAKYNWWLLSLSAVTLSCNDGGYIHSSGYAPLAIIWICFLLVAFIWFGTIARFFMKIPLNTPMGSGHYLKFLWETRLCRWYTVACRILEVVAVVSIFVLFAAATAYMGADALAWVFREKLVEGLFVIISMRQFTRPVLPCFNFDIEDFERIRFKLGIIFNSNAIVHELHGDFCRAFADGVSLVEDVSDQGAIHSMLKSTSNNQSSRLASE